MDPDKLAGAKAPVLLWGGDLEVATLGIFDGAGGQLSADERTALLERARKGEAVSVRVEARTFVQRDTPNRNFIRVAPKALNAMNKSFKGVPFLRDHDQRSLDARGGTVIESRLEKTDEGAELIQVLHLVKPWAVEGVLDGTIDRFSIGFHPTGPVTCSVHKTPVFRDCSCFPGEKAGKDAEGRVEFVVTAADGVEVSAVNVPAVLGTGVQDIRAALAALNWRAPRAPEESPMIRVRERLSLAENATEDQILGVLERREVEHEALSQRCKLAESRLAEFEQSRKRDQLARLDGDIEQLYTSGRLPYQRDASGARVAHPLELSLRRIADQLGYDAFQEHVASMPPSHGPAALQSAPSAAAASATATRPIDQAALRLNISPDLMRETLEQLGLGDDIVAKHGPRQGV